MAPISAPPGPAAQVALRRTAELVAGDANRIAQEIAELLHREVPETADDPLSLAETQRTVRVTLLALVDSWRRGTPPEGMTLAPELLFQIGVMVRDGIPLQPLLRICHLGHGAFAQAWDERIARSDLSAELQAQTMRMAHQLTFTWFAGLVDLLTTAYLQEQERVARSPETQRRDAVQAALSGQVVDQDALGRAAAYEFRRHHTGLVIWRGASPTPTTAASFDAQPALTGVARAIAAELRAGPPLVVASASAVAWAWSATHEPPDPAVLRLAVDRARPPDTSVAFGVPAAGLAGFRDTHDDALAAARIAMLHGGGGASAAIAFEDVELAALLSEDLHRARRFVTRQLGRLATDDAAHARLRATLRVYLEEHGARSVTAARLNIHPNTATNRVRVCETLIGRPLSERPVELQVALALAETIGV
jgi:DNA-binding PucR family transcriptional regulator